LVDVRNKILFLTNNDCENFTSTTLTWSPDVLALHPVFTDIIAGLDNKTKSLYISKDFGKTWTLASSNVKSFYWWIELICNFALLFNPAYLYRGVAGLDTNRTMFVEEMTNNSTQASKVWRNDDLFISNKKIPLMSNVMDFEVFDDYLFVVQNLSSQESLSLFVSHERGPFSQAKFPPDADGKKLLERVWCDRLLNYCLHLADMGRIMTNNDDTDKWMGMGEWLVGEGMDILTEKIDRQTDRQTRQTDR
jgi:hypothetical protein